ncbi:MAG: VOC family protein, partial [Dehalococcoidia bacterium]
GAGGRDVHPNSTCGVLIRVYPVDSFAGNAPAHEGDAGLSGIRRVIIAVRDLSHAVKVYGEMFALQTSPPAADAERGVESAICTPGGRGVIELVSVKNPSRPFAAAVVSFLEARGEGMYALVLDADEPAAAARILAQRGVESGPSADSDSVFEVSRNSAFGALLRIEPRTP